MKKSFKYSVPTFFGVILFSIFLQFCILDAYPWDITATTINWILFIIVFFMLFALSSLRKGGAHESRRYIFPLLVIIGSAVMIVVIPNLMHYNSTFFGLEGDELPLTATLSIVVWVGLLRMEGKFILARIFYAILTGVTTYLFLYNIAGVLWDLNVFVR